MPPAENRPTARRLTGRAEPVRQAALDAIEDYLAGATVHALAKLAGVYPSIIHNFRAGKGLTLANLDRLARPLGLALVRPPSRPRAGRQVPSNGMNPKAPKSGKDA